MKTEYFAGKAAYIQLPRIRSLRMAGDASGKGPTCVDRALIADNEQSSFAAAWPKSKAGGH
jgi:hypothetical protein